MFESPSRFILDGWGVTAWRQSMGVFIPGAEHSPKFKKKYWDGKAYPGLRDPKGVFRLGRGLLPRVLADLAANIRVPPPVPPIDYSRAISQDTLNKLRDYQQEALHLIFQKRWGRIALPTNAGKGAVIALAAKAVATAQMSSLVLCDEISVFNALHEEIAKWALRAPTLVGAGVDTIPKPGAITLAMVPTLARRIAGGWPAWFNSIDAVFCDEADRAASPQWQRVLDRCVNSHVRIGFSGTFLQEDSPEELKLSESIGPVLLRRKNSDMIDRGVSAKPFVELIRYPHLIVIPFTKKQWREMSGPVRRQYIFDRWVVHNTDRHQLIESLLDPGSANAIIVNYIEHGQNLAALIPNSVFLDGSASAATREGVLDEFKKGAFQHLIVSKILDRGTNDLGHAAGIVFASGMGSSRQTLQRIGRGLRRTGGKKFLFLKDVLDTGYSYFDSQSRKRVLLYNEEGFDVTIRG